MTTMSIEPGSAADYLLFRRLFEELETGDPPTSEADFVAQIAPNMLVARAPSGQALGYVFAEVFGPACYVRHIVTSPSARKKGVGRALLTAAARRGATLGAKHLELNVKLGNSAALALYEGFGMRAAYETVVLRMAWRAVPSAAAGGEEVIEVDAALAPVVEARFELPHGLILRHATSPQHVVRATRRGDEITGVASLRISFPGVFPLRAGSSDGALALLAALHPHAIAIADAERPWRDGGVQLTLEDSPAAAEALLAAGAREVFRLAHMKGPI